MTILVDTREQMPLRFPANPALEKVEETTLTYGDYMIRFSDGTIPPVTFERKSLADLFGTLGKGYERFKAEFLGAKEAGLSFVLLIEASLSQVAQGYPRSSIPGSQIVQQLFTLMTSYGIRVVFCQDAEEAGLWLLEQAKAVGRRYAATQTVREVFGAVTLVEPI